MERSRQLKQERATDPGVLRLKKHTMNPQEQQEELKIIQDAFAALAKDKPELLYDFMAAFSERSQFPELPESHNEGLTRVLSRLLWTYVPQIYFERNFSGDTNTAAGQDQILRLSTALAGVAHRHPFVIVEFRRIREERKITIRSALEACLHFYVDNKAVFPG